MLDIFYLTYLDDYSKENFERIKELALPGQNVIHIKDIDGIYNGHKECALQSSTKHFFVIDGDGWVLGNFDFSYVPNETDEVYPQTSTAQCTHVWRAVNPATGQTYGYGGVKLFAREAFMDKAYIDIQHPLDKRIDYIFTSNYKIISHRHIDDRLNNNSLKDSICSFSGAK